MEYVTVIILSWYQTDANGKYNVVVVKDRFVMQTWEMKSFKEEVDSGMISHISQAGKKNEAIVVSLKDTDAVIYNLAFLEQFKREESSRSGFTLLPNHFEAEKFFEEKCLDFFKAHLLTDCDCW